MIEHYFLYLCLSVLVARTIERSVTMIGSSVYDVRSIRRSKGYKGSGQKTQTISAVVLAHNNEDVIEACLNAIARADGNGILQIVVIDNCSTDRTVQILKQYQSVHNDQNLRVIKKRKAAPELKAYAAAQRYVTGDIVLMIAGDMLLDRAAAVEVQKEFAAMRPLHGLQLNVHVQAYPSFVVLLQRFEALQRAQQHKTGAVLGNGSALEATGTPAVLTHQSFVRLGRMPVVVQYASTTAVYQQPRTALNTLYAPADSRQNKLTGGIRRLLQTMEPCAAGYFFYLAYTGRNSTLFLLSLGLFAVWQAQLVWQESRAGLFQKIGLTLLTPILFVLDFVRSVALLVFRLGYVIASDASRATKLFSLYVRKYYSIFRSKISRGVAEQV